GTNAPCAVVGDGKDPLAALLDNPSQIVVDAAGDVIFSDRGNARIRILIANPVSSSNPAFGGFSAINTIVGTGANGNAGDGGNARFAAISTGTNGLALDLTNNRLFFTDRTNNRARLFDLNSG